MNLKNLLDRVMSSNHTGHLFPRQRIKYCVFHGYIEPNVLNYIKAFKSQFLWWPQRDLGFRFTFLLRYKGLKAGNLL